MTQKFTMVVLCFVLISQLIQVRWTSEDRRQRSELDAALLKMVQTYTEARAQEPRTR